MTKYNLTDIEVDKKYKIIEFQGGPNMRKKLENLGIRLNTNIEVVNNSFIGGPITVLSGNSKIAIGRRMAKRIIVEDEE